MFSSLLLFSFFSFAFELPEQQSVCHRLSRWILFNWWCMLSVLLNTDYSCKEDEITHTDISFKSI